MPNPTDLHIDRPLTNFMVDYQNTAFIADLVCPPVPTENKSDKFYIYSKKDRFTLSESIRGPKDEAKTIDWSVTEEGFSCIDHALKDFLSDSTVKNSDSQISPRIRTVEILSDLILLSREMRVKTLCFDPANFSADMKIDLSGADRFDQYAQSDPIGVIDAAKSACLMEPNTIVFGKKVFNYVQRHPQVLDRIKGGATSRRPARATIDALKEIFEVKNIYVPTCKYNSANKGQDAIFDYIWGNYILVANVNPDPQMIGVSFLKAFRLKQPQADDQGSVVRSWRDESRGGGGEWIECECSEVAEKICPDLGVLITNPIF